MLLLPFDHPMHDTSFMMLGVSLEYNARGVVYQRLQVCVGAAARPLMRLWRVLGAASAHMLSKQLYLVKRCFPPLVRENPPRAPPRLS